jgi:glutamate-1-semialdehyde 2,1-aminomutase
MQELQLLQSRQSIDSLKRHLPGGVHYNFRALAKEPIPFRKGKGSRLWDLDGNEHLDLFCKFGALIVGHLNEDYNARLMTYMSKVISVGQCDLDGPVCERIIHHVPSAEMVRFGLSGTESVQNAIRLARAFTGKRKFVRFYGHYHGSADNIMGGKPCSPQSQAPADYDGDLMGTRGRFPNILQEQSLIIQWNDSEVLEKLLQEHSDEIAAVIMEPVSINGGGVSPKPGYLERVRELCDQHQVLLIFDEVITGFRMSLGGAQSVLNVMPDITVFGKAIAGGALPVSVIAGRRDIMQLYENYEVTHGGTFNGYQLGLAAVMATIEMLENDTTCYERMGSHMAQIGQCLEDAAKNVGLPMVVQGFPCGLVFHVQEAKLEYPGDFSDATMIQDVILAQICQSYGIQFAPVSRFFSNTMMDESDVSFFKERIGEAMFEAKTAIEEYMAQQVNNSGMSQP